MRALRSRVFLPCFAVVIAAVSGACNGKFGVRDDQVVPIPPPPGPQPQYGSTKSLSDSPAPISGGTLTITKSGLAVASDPDRDRVLLADLAAGTVSAVALSAHDEPGRVVEDDAGRVHVVLRRGGAIATIDLATKAVVARRALCGAPRGIAWSATKQLLYVACAGGEFIGIAKDADTPTLHVQLDRDLRDVVLGPSTIMVTTFRSAEILSLADDGSVLSRATPPARDLILSEGQAQPEVAWRTVATVDGQIIMAHQRARDPNAVPVSTAPGGYSSDGSDAGTTGSAIPKLPPCGIGIVHSAVTTFTIAGSTVLGMSSPPIADAVLPVDVAVPPTPSSEVALVAAGNGHTPQLPQIFFASIGAVDDFSECARPPRTLTPPGQAIAAAYAGATLVVQTREPAALLSYSNSGELLSTLPLGGETREDTGHAIFHSNSGGFLACASCHPEGGDDGHVWSFAKVGPRRTQNLRGGISGSAPFHWDGDLADLDALMGEVFERRMSGPSLSAEQVKALGTWVDAVPHLPPLAVDATKAAHGATLFKNAGCPSCHHDGSNLSVDVGTGGLFQIPRLRGVGYRTPVMHTGCAATLKDRFDPACGGSNHGSTSGFSPSDVDDVIAYLESL